MIRRNRFGSLSEYEADRPKLQPDEFQLFRDFVNERAGLNFDDSARFYFERRVGERMSALELKRGSDYYKYLRFNEHGAEELEHLLDALTTSETYFFRQEYQLRAFKNDILPELAVSNATSKRISIWSAGCSTGEEVYTLAILVEQSGLFGDWEKRIVGSDLCKSRVAIGRRGVYSGGSFRTIDPQVRKEYFVEERDGSHISERIKRNCHFGQVNLLDAGRASLVGKVDVIFCRNVLIYFDAVSRRKVIDNLYDRLVPGGYLLLGHSESLINVTTAFELAHLSEDLVYRRPQRQRTR